MTPQTTLHTNVMSKPNETDTGVENRRLWGEMDDGEADTNEIGLSVTERDALCRMQKPLHLEGPKIHQPSTFRVPTGVNSAASNPENLVTNGIRLRQYINAAAAYMEQVRDQRIHSTNDQNC